MNPALRRELQDWLAARGSELGRRQWQDVDVYVRAVLEYGGKVNLTADLDEAAILTRHVADGWAACLALRGKARFPTASPSLLDLGAGAGFAGIAVKIAWPESRVTLMEPSHRKFRFLNWISARLGLPGLRVLRRAAGGPGTAPEAYDAVLARALAPLPEALRLASGLAKRGTGLCLIHQSAPPDMAQAAWRRSLSDSGVRLEAVEPYRLPREPNDRHLLIMRRIQEER